MRDDYPFHPEAPNPAGWVVLVIAVASLGFAALFADRVATVKARRTLEALSVEQVAREGKTDKSYYAQNPKHFPINATSVRGKTNGSTTQAQEANRECGAAH